MAIFRYKAITSSGESIEGEMEAASRDEVVGKLQDAGNIPLDASEAGAAGAGVGLTFLRRSEMTQAETTQFAQQLATLLGAGQPLDRALQILVDMPENERGRKLVERVRDFVRGGGTLSNALEQQHGQFSRLYINMVRAGEASGTLHETLKRLGDYLERSKALRDTIVSALTYPAILLLMVVGALALLLLYVVPQFLPLFEDMGAELPFITKFVLFLGDTLQGFWWLILAIMVGGVAYARRQLANADSRLLFDAWLLKRGKIGDLVAKVETARLSRTLGTLVDNGVPLLMALSIARNVVGNSAMAVALEAATNDVKTGSGLSHALGKSRMFPRLALQMVAVGEESGELDAMLLKVADTFDVEVKTTVDRLLAALVPAITIVMAVLVAFIMLAILMPILDLSSQIG